MSAGEIAVANGWTVGSRRHASGCERQRRHDLARERLLRGDREVAVEAGVVDGVRSVGDLGDERADAVAKRRRGPSRTSAVVIPGSKSSSSGS